MKESLSLYN